MNLIIKVLLIALAVILIASCDAVNTDQAEDSALEQYQRTNTGTFPAKVHLENYWNSSHSLNCTNENPVRMSFYNLNPPGIKGFHFDTTRELPDNTNWLQLIPEKTGSEHHVTGWSVPGSENEFYTIHAWLKNTFGKGIYAGSADLVYDTEPPELVSYIFDVDPDNPVISLKFKDLTLNTDIISIDDSGDNYKPSENKEVICSGNIQLYEYGIENCIPFNKKPEFRKDDDYRFSWIDLSVSKLTESAVYTSGDNQTANFMTQDVSPPKIISSTLTEYPEDNSRVKIDDEIILKFTADERLSEGVPKEEPNIAPQVDFWFKTESEKQTYTAIKDESDLTGKTWNLKISTTGVPWTRVSSQSGDQIKYKIYNYYDLKRERDTTNSNEFIYNPNKGEPYQKVSDVIFDNIKPDIIVTDFKSNNDNQTFAKNKDELTLEFYANESIKPTVYFLTDSSPNCDDKFMADSVTSSGQIWEATYTFRDTEDAPCDYIATIEYLDLADNVGISKSSLDNISYVKKPQLVSYTIQTNNPNYSYILKDQEKAIVELEADENIQTPLVNLKAMVTSECDDVLIADTVTGSGKTWIAEYLFKNTEDSQCDYKAYINYEDLAGNSGDEIVIPEIIRYDNETKNLNPLLIYSDNEINRIDYQGYKASWSKPEDNITIEFTSDETIKVSNVYLWTDNKSDNLTANFIPLDADNKTWKAYLKLNNNLNGNNNDNLSFQIDFSDKANNRHSCCELTTDDSIVFF